MNSCERRFTWEHKLSHCVKNFEESILQDNFIYNSVVLVPYISSDFIIVSFTRLLYNYMCAPYDFYIKTILCRYTVVYVCIITNSDKISKIAL